MSPLVPGHTGFWVAVGGWIAAIALLGWIIRIMKKNAPKGMPELIPEFRETWNRDWKRFPLYADLPRLARKVYIHTRDGNTLSPPDNAILAVKQLIVGLAEQLFDWSPISQHRSATIKTKLDVVFEGYNDDTGDMQGLVRKFLDSNDQLLGEELIGLLKTVTQDMVAPGVIKMKRGLSPNMRYKDVRGEWFIHISFESNEAVIVSHQKREQSFGHDEGQEFEFQWNLDLLFDAQVKALRATALYIPILEFGPNASPDTKSRVQLLLDDYTRL